MGNGAMLLLGGYNPQSDEVQSGIWILKNDVWSRIGDLLQPASSGNAIYIGRSVYFFQYNYNQAIYRLDLNETEELEKVEKIGEQPGGFLHPVLFQAGRDYCV